MRCVVVLVGLLVCARGAAAAVVQREERGGVLRATLGNGLRVVVVPDTLAPVVTTVVNYLVGSDEAPDGFPGTAHAQEHMMFRGSPGLSGDQLAAIAAAMGGSFNADTQQTVTQYFFTIPVEDLGLTLRIEAIRMGGVLDSEALWQRERGAIEQEVAQDLSDPEYVLQAKLLATLFRGTPYAHDALGTRPSFNATTGAMLGGFHQDWYAPNNAILVIVGDVEPARVLEEVDALFGNIAAKTLPARPWFRPRPVTPETVRLATGRPYGLAVVAFRLPGSGGPGWGATRVLADVLSSQRGRLYALAAAGKALAARFSLDALPAASIGSAQVAFPRGADSAALVREIRRILATYASDGVPADLVEAAKRRALTRGQLERNSVSGLAMAWSRALAVEGRSSPDDDVEAIRRTSAADVTRLARTSLDLDHAVVGVLTPTASGAPLTTTRARGGEFFASEPPEHIELPAWASHVLARAAIPASSVHPTDTTLPNGLRLIVQPETVSDAVSVYGRVRNEPHVEAPEGQEGVNELLDRLFPFGSTSLGGLAFQEALDAIGAEETAGADFSVKVLADHFERGVELLADNVLHPALPPDAFVKMRHELAATVAGRLESPDYLANRALFVALFPPHDPTLRQATPATIASLTRDDVRRYHDHVFRPELTTIVVIGRVTPETARAAVERWFDDWRGTGPTPDTMLPPVPANHVSTVTVPDPARVQDRVTLAETLGIARSDPDYYALELGNEVLGGPFYASRLSRDLRERRGLVYNVSSSFDVRRTRAAYLASYGCDPPNAARTRALVERDLRDMQQSRIGSDELRQARVLLLRRIPLSESSVEGIAQALLFRSEHALPLDEPIRAAERYVKLTADEVRAAFARWLRPDDLVDVTQGPGTRP